MTAMRVIAASITGLAFAASISAAAAADTLAVGTTASDMTFPVYDDPGFDWEGFYAGVHGTAQLDPATPRFGAGFDFGYTMALDLFLVGAEVSLNGLSDGTELVGYAQIVGRAGVIVTDDLVAYGAAGYGSELTSAPDDHLLLGGGLEFAVTEDVSLRGQYLYGFPVSGDATQQVTVGANFHF